jgi:hypothetical protein
MSSLGRRLDQVSAQLRRALEAATPDESGAQIANARGPGGGWYSAVLAGGQVRFWWARNPSVVAGTGDPLEAEPDGVEWKSQKG